VTTDPRGILPEFYDALLGLLLQARENTRAEGLLLAVQVFEDAATVAASLAEDLRNLGEGKVKIVIVPSEKTVTEVFVELDSWENLGLSRAEALAQVFPPKHRLPSELGPYIVCFEDFVPGDVAVKAPSEDATGCVHLECLAVVIIDEPPATDAGPM
jgi:hypothetical protein